MNNLKKLSIKNNYFNLINEIFSLRPSNPPKVISVSKFQPIEKIQEAIEAGIHVFGENRIQEGIKKFSILDPNKNLELHHIGPVQKGTLRKLFGYFQFTHGIGSYDALSEFFRRSKIEISTIKYFIQLNLTNETTKFGFSKSEFSKLIKNIHEFSNDRCLFFGLMTMGPSDGDEKNTREVFRELFQLKQEYCPHAKLSMGMSGDYKIAIEEGTDYIRIGSKIFGEREV